MTHKHFRKTFKFLTLLEMFASAAFLLVAASCGGSTLYPGSNLNDAQNLLVQYLQSSSQTSCISYKSSPISNIHFTGGTRTLYLVSECTDTGWKDLGFTYTFSNPVHTVRSDVYKVVTDSSFSGWGTNIEVTFTVTDPAGTLDVMAYGQGTFPDTSTTNPTVEFRAGSGCSLGYRSSTTGNITDFTTCLSGVITAGNTYTYCIDFARGIGESGGLYTFGDMLAAWPKPCKQVTTYERSYMTGITFMQMDDNDVPRMNLSQDGGAVGFSSNGMTLNSFLIGNTIYQ